MAYVVLSIFLMPVYLFREFLKAKNGTGKQKLLIIMSKVSFDWVLIFIGIPI